jgi:exodeoxyribonuclease VII large subunit
VTDLFDLPFEEAPDPDPAPAAASPGAAANGRGRAERTVFTVSELTAEIRALLETRFCEVWVEGEISNCKIWNTGHLYFTLKDSNAQIKCLMFRSALRYLRFKAEDGLHVVARGRVSVYDPKGEYQLVCEHLEPQGLGALQLAFEQLKTRLQAAGLFDAGRKRALPALPRKIGIVTSLDGAAIRDILKVLRRRYPNAQVVIRPARVQGEGAAGDVARGLRAIARVANVDVIIVGRGGGSIEDLWAFNEEVVARAIAAMPVPVISAVGHETDVTIADYVADVRAPTPSAAAELVVARKDDFCARIDRLAERLRTAARARVTRLEARVHGLMRRPAIAGYPARVGMRARRTADVSHQLRQIAAAQLARRVRRYEALRLRLEQHDLRRVLASMRTRLVNGDVRLRTTMDRRRQAADAHLRSAAGRLDSLSPLAVLGRGYAVCWNAERTEILRDAARVNPGEDVSVTLARGELRCEVRSRIGNPESRIQNAPDV